MGKWYAVKSNAANRSPKLDLVVLRHPSSGGGVAIVAVWRRAFDAQRRETALY